MNEQQLWKLPPEVREHYRRLMQMGIEISEDEAEAIIAEAHAGEADAEGEIPKGDGSPEGEAEGENSEGEGEAEGGEDSEAEGEAEGGEDSEAEGEAEGGEATENFDVYVQAVAGLSVNGGGGKFSIGTEAFDGAADIDGVTFESSKDDVPRSLVLLGLTEADLRDLKNQINRALREAKEQ